MAKRPLWQRRDGSTNIQSVQGVQLYRFLTIPVDEFMTTKMYKGGQANCPRSGAKKGHWRDSPGLAMV